MASRRQSLLSRIGLILVLTVLPLLTDVSAQTQRGQIVGRVTDSTGAVIPGAKIEVSDPSTGVKLETQTNEGGIYTVPYVQYGRYEIKVSATGFGPHSVSRVEVSTASTTTVNVELKVSAVAAEVTVQEASTVVLESMSSGVGAVVEEKLKTELPNIVSGQKRNALTYIYSGPGVNAAGSGYFGPTEQMTVGGGRTLDHLITLDGQTTSTWSAFTNHGPTTCLQGGCSGGDLPSVEAVGEFKLLLNSMPAEYGRSSGATMILSSKSGTNDFHGVAYEYLRNHKLDARPWEAPTRNVLKQNEFGVAGGGPLILPGLYNGRGRTFFWANFTGYKRRSDPSTGVVTLPTEAMRRGDFSAPDLNPIYDVLDRFTDSSGNPQRRQFSSGGRLNVIDPARLSKVSKYFLDKLPLPNGPGSVNNFVGSSRSTLDTWDISTKFDHHFGNKSRFSVYYEWGDQDLGEGSILGDFFGRSITTEKHRTRLDWSYNIRSNLIHQAIYGFTRPTNSSVQNSFGENVGRAAGITGTPDGNCPAIWFVHPNFGICGQSGPNDRSANLINTFNDSIVWNKGRHNIKAGFELVRWTENSVATVESAGYYIFNSGQTANINNTGGDLWASVVLGYPQQARTASQMPLGLRQSYYALFLQDDWRVTPKLTVSAGLRWDLNSPYTEVHDQVTNLDLTRPNPGANNLPGALTFFGEGPGRNGLKRLGPTHWKDFGPRLGLAYQLDSKTVFRGFAGIVQQGIQGNGVDGFFFADRAGFQASGSPRPAVDPFGLYYSWDTPFPQDVLGTVPFTNPAFRNGQGAQYIDPDGYGRSTELYMWSAGFQRELPFNILAEATYSSNNSKHAQARVQMNQLAPQFRSLGPLLNRPLNSPEVQAAGFRAPFPEFDTNLPLFRALLPYPQFSGIRRNLSPHASSTYHSVLFKVQKRFSTGLSFLASYTISKYISDAGWGVGAGDNRDSYDRRNDKAIQRYDIPQRLALSYSYDLPFGRGKKFASNASKPVDVLVGGWTIAGLHQYQSGIPASLVGNLSIGIPTVISSPNMVPGVPLRSSLSCSEMEFRNPQKNYLFNAGNPAQAARTGRPLAITPSGDYQLGNMPVLDPRARDCGTLNEDMSFTKSISIRERVRVRFGADMFNIFNRHTWQARKDRNNVSASDFGEITPFQVAGPRQVQLKFRVEW